MCFAQRVHCFDAIQLHSLYESTCEPGAIAAHHQHHKHDENTPMALTRARRRRRGGDTLVSVPVLAQSSQCNCIKACILHCSQYMKPSAPSIPNHRRCGKSWNLEEIMLNHVRSRIVGNDGKPTSTTVCQPLGWAGTSTSAKQRDDAYGNVNVSRRRRHTAPRSHSHGGRHERISISATGWRRRGGWPAIEHAYGLRSDLHRRTCACACRFVCVNLCAHDVCVCVCVFTRPRQV